jgi:cytochrome c oxidase subunit 1
VFAGGANGHDEEEEGHGIHLPSPSFWPVVAAIGLPIMGYGVLSNEILIGVGGLISALGFYGWVLEPQTAEDH